MTKFIIRSMSTTDYRPAWRDGHGNFTPAQQPVPYHCYLMTPEKRRSAYWSRFAMDAVTFDTEEAAQAEIDRLGLTSCDVAPVDHERTGFPSFWDRRDGKQEA